MIDIFADLIIDHRKTFGDVPDPIKDAVKAELKRRGYDTEGEPLPVNDEPQATTE